jgi:small ligand-binding sensory domain FIST
MTVIKPVAAGLLAALLLSTPTARAADDAAPTLEFAFEEIVTLGAVTNVGKTGHGGRTIIPITGGTVSGPRFKGVVMPGGWDWQLLRSDGCTELEENYLLRAEDGTIINVVNKGVACPQGPGATPLRTMAVFETPTGPHDWLAKSAFVGVLVPYQAPGGPAVKIRFYQVR